jgi:hypothetical protein
MMKAGIAKFSANQTPNTFVKIDMANKRPAEPDVPVFRSCNNNVHSLCSNCSTELLVSAVLKYEHQQMCDGCRVGSQSCTLDHYRLLLSGARSGRRIFELGQYPLRHLDR